MPSCKEKAKCYQTQKKKCRTPNAWVVFLRTHKNLFKGGEASKYYKKSFRPVLDKWMRGLSNKYTVKRAKELYRKKLCKYFYETMKAVGTDTPSNKKKVSSGVTKLLKNNSVPKALSMMGAKEAAAAVSAKEKAQQKAAAELVAAQKIAAFVKKRAGRVISKHLLAAARAKKLRREAAAAKSKAAVSRRSPARSSSSRKTPAASSGSVSKKVEVAQSAKRKADAMGAVARVARESVKNAEQDVAEAKKKKQKVDKQRLAVSRLATGLKGAPNTRANTRQGTRQSKRIQPARRAGLRPRK
jgi:hypothetical protein